MPPPDAPDGLWFRHIHHMGELANSSVVAPRAVAFCSMARWFASAVHFHAEDVIVVYLRGGYTYPGADFWGAVRVGRGDVDVIPANTMHRLANAGSDPLELLVIVPK